MKNPDSEFLEQVTSSIFGLAFIAHCAGVRVSKLGTVDDPILEIIGACADFNMKLGSSDIWALFSHFIREYPFGEFAGWRNYSHHLDETQGHLSLVWLKLQKAVDIGAFAGPFDPAHQVVLATNLQKMNLSSDRTSIWEQDDPSAWWTTPRAVFSLQRPAPELANLALDDAVPQPDAWNHLEFSNLDPNEILEVQDLQGWVALVEEFPSRINVTNTECWENNSSRLTPSVMVPDWAWVATKYVGVHLTPAAFLALSYCLIPIAKGEFSLIAGWSPGATYWLPKVTR